jgi:hypothetical protein
MSNICFSNLPINRLAYEITIFLIIAVLFIYMMEIAYIQRKKSLRIPKGQSESVYRRRTDNTTANRKSTKWQRSTKHTHKTKDRETRTPLKTVGELRCHGRVSSSCSTSGTRLRCVFSWFSHQYICIWNCHLYYHSCHIDLHDGTCGRGHGHMEVGFTTTYAITTDVVSSTLDKWKWR